MRVPFLPLILLAAAAPLAAQADIAPFRPGDSPMKRSNPQISEEAAPIRTPGAIGGGAMPPARAYFVEVERTGGLVGGTSHGRWSATSLTPEQNAAAVAVSKSNCGRKAGAGAVADGYTYRVTFRSPEGAERSGSCSTGDGVDLSPLDSLLTDRR